MRKYLPWLLVALSVLSTFLYVVEVRHAEYYEEKLVWLLHGSVSDTHRTLSLAVEEDNQELRNQLITDATSHGRTAQNLIFTLSPGSGRTKNSDVIEFIEGPLASPAQLGVKSEQADASLRSQINALWRFRNEIDGLSSARQFEKVLQRFLGE